VWCRTAIGLQARLPPADQYHNSMSQDWKKLQKLPQLLKNKQPQKLMEEETKPLTEKGFETLLATPTTPERRNTPFETERIKR